MNTNQIHPDIGWIQTDRKGRWGQGDSGERGWLREKKRKKKQIRETERDTEGCEWGRSGKMLLRETEKEWKQRDKMEKEKLLQWLLAAWYSTDHAPMGKTPRATTKDTRGAGSMWTGPVCPARPGDSSALTHTHTHTAHQSSCCHNNSPCALLIGTACLARQQQGERQTHTQKVHNRRILQENGCDWHHINGCNMKTCKATEQIIIKKIKKSGACESNGSKWVAVLHVLPSEWRWTLPQQNARKINTH